MKILNSVQLNLKSSFRVALTSKLELSFPAVECFTLIESLVWTFVVKIIVDKCFDRILRQMHWRRRENLENCILQTSVLLASTSRWTFAIQTHCFDFQMMKNRFGRGIINEYLRANEVFEMIVQPSKETMIWKMKINDVDIENFAFRSN